MSISLDGLASGLPTNSIIEQLMAIEQQPLYVLNQKKEDLEVEKDAWRDINTRLSNLEEKLTDLKLSATFNSNKTTSTDEGVATATASSDAIASSYEITVTTLARVHRVASDNAATITGISGADSTTDLNLNGDTGGSFDLTINGITFTINIGKDDTLEDIVLTINDTAIDAEGNQIIKASVVDNTLIIEGANTGAINQLNFTDTDGILQELGVINADSSIKHQLQTAGDAQFDINGLTVTRSTNEDIDDVVKGLSFTLKESGSTTIEVSRDVNKAVSAVQSFVNQYNSVMSFIDTNLYYDWEGEEEGSESGTLVGNGTLMRLQRNIRNALTDRVTVDGEYNQLAMVGIEVDRDGVMSLDTDKFKEALEKAPEEVTALFQADSADGDSFDGVATRLDSYLNFLLKANTGVIPETLDTYDQRIEDIDTQVESFEERLAGIRERYVRQFTAMEEAISRMQAQGSWLATQLSQLSTTSAASTLGY
jgi:flagellar hook-associated protein 2